MVTTEIQLKNISALVDYDDRAKVQTFKVLF